MKSALVDSLGIKITVIKKREIYYIQNVKFHLDEIASLGNFIEIEAGNILADKNAEELGEQCSFYMRELKISPDTLIEVSYSDMLLEKESTSI